MSMVFAKEICEGCGKVFVGGQYAFFCPECRRRRQSEAAKRRNLSRIGVEARRKKGGGEE